MKKIILSVAVSLDGFIEGPDKEIDWISFNAEDGSALNEFLQEIDTILYGRASYEAWGNYTPPADASAFEKEIYNTTNLMSKYVFSTSKTRFEGNVKVVQSDILNFVKELQRQPGKNIWLYGGASLTTTFMNLDLVDEFRMAVMPVILGDGNRLFRDIRHRTNLRLIKAESTASGVLGLQYERLR